MTTLMLMLIGALLIVFNIRFLNGKNAKPTVNPKEKEKTFRKIYEDEEMDTSAVDIIIGELRVEFSETILELQKEIQGLNKRLDDLTSSAVYSAAVEPPVEEAQELPISKMEQIGLLLQRGHTVDELCEKFQMGRGEILLIQKLYRK